jgi:hypothetical protein
MKPGPAKALFPPASGDSAGQSAIQARTYFVFVYLGRKKFGQISVVDPDPEPFGLFGFMFALSTLLKSWKICQLRRSNT